MRSPLLALAAALAACTSTYHPEYHPVTVTSVNQTYSAPVAVAPAPATTTASPVTVIPAQAAAPLVVPEPALADPGVVFSR